jgi:hypothetical protein
MLPVRQFDAEHFIFMATARGTVKKTALTEFSNPRKAGIIAVDLDEGDFLIGAAVTDGQHDVMLFSDAGKAVRFDENDVRPMGRQARGVRGMNLEEGQAVIAMLVRRPRARRGVQRADRHRERLRQAHPISEYTRHGRGTKGMIAIQTSERNGKRGGRGAGFARRRDHADHDRRRADPHPRGRDPRDGPRHAGRDADQRGRRHQAVGPAAHRRKRRRQRFGGRGRGECGAMMPPGARPPMPEPLTRMRIRNLLQHWTTAGTRQTAVRTNPDVFSRES